MLVSRVRSVWLVRYGWVGLLAATMVLLATGWAVGETATRYLRLRFAPVTTGPSFGSEAKASAPANQACSVLERSKDGDWVKVRLAPATEDQEKADSVEGWIHATALAEKPLPAERDAGCRWLQEGGKALPEAGTAVKEHAARRRQGLKPLMDSETLYPSQKELDAFLKDGSLGLYRPDWPSLEGGLTQ
jgi:hypothetical protein